MTTKEGYLYFKDKPKGFVDDTVNDKYRNLNLNNQNHQNSFKETLSFQNDKIDSKNNQNYDISLLNILQAQNKDSNSWNKSKKHFSSTSFLNVKCESEEKDEFKKSKSFNNSTHSLHIATYENSAEATADSDGVKNEKAQKKGGENLGLSKKWRTSNDFIDGLKLIIQNQFEFPRQQDNLSCRPEVMQFKASQCLLNPNQMNANNQTPHGSPSIMLRKIKKEAASPPVVTIDSDSGSDNEFVQVFKDNVSTDVSLENNRIMIADLIALFPNFHGIQLVGNSMNRFYSKTKFAKKGYFIAPPAGWESVKIIIVVLPTTAESLNSTPRSTPILNEAADNIEPMDCENPKLVKQQDITVPPNVTPIQISDDDIFHRFNVTNLVQLYALPQFLNHSGFALQHFLVYRDNFIKFFRGTLMALGPESFHLSTVFSLNNRICDFTRLLNSLEMSKRIECKICEILFTEPQSAFQHYCSISHGEKHLAARNSEATEVRDILKLAKENMMFPPPLHPRPLMSQMVRPPTLIHANPPMNIQRQSRWDVRPAFASIIPPPVLPQLVQMQRVEPYLSNVPGFCATALPRRNFASGPTPQPLLLERQTNGENDVVTNENEDAQAPSSSVTVSRVKREKRKPPTPPVLHESNSENNGLTNENEDNPAPSSSVTVSRVKREKRKPPTPPVLHESNSENDGSTNGNNSRAQAPSSSAVSRVKREKRKRQISDESESSSEEETPPQLTKKASAKPQIVPSQPKKKRQNTDVVAKPQRSAAKKQTQKKPEPPPVVRDASDSESSDFEAVAHMRPIKGEFGDANIGRDPQIPEKELLHHFHVKSIVELKKLRPMNIPYVIKDIDDFNQFRNYAFDKLRNVLVKASKVNRLMFVLFMASKAEVSFKTLDKNAKEKCSMCKEDLTLKHILSRRHINLYREKYFCDPDEILVMLEPKNQKYYATDEDERAVVLRDFNVHSYEMLKVKPQFHRNRFYEDNNSALSALKHALIERLKRSKNLRIDPRCFWLEKMLFLKYEAEKNEQLIPLLMEIFEEYERKCNACDMRISSWLDYMKHIISKSHIRKELTQTQMNLILNAMWLIKDTEDGYEVVPPKKRKRGAPQRHFTDSSDGESSDASSSPPDDPVTNKKDSAASLEEMKHRLSSLKKFKKLTSKQAAEKQNLIDEIANLEN